MSVFFNITCLLYFLLLHSSLYSPELSAESLGLSSCIIARGEETFDNPEGQKFLEEWEIPQEYTARCFVLLGYIEDPEPSRKILHEGRFRIIE